MTNATAPNHKELALKLATEEVELPEKIKYLAFAGGGATAFAELGVYNALHDNGELENLEAVSGTSAGSMMATLVALGYRGDDFKPLTVEQDFSILTSFEETSEKLALLPNLLGDKKGIFTGDGLNNWIEHAIAKRTGHPKMTFEELHQWREAAAKSQATGDLSFFNSKAEQALDGKNIEELSEQYEKFHNIEGKPFTLDFTSGEELRDNLLKMKDLHVVAAKVKGSGDHKLYEETIFSHESEQYKAVPIAQAVEASASFPFVFAKERIGDELFTDGGLVNNIPIEIFDGPNGEVNENAVAISVNYVPSDESRSKDSTQDKFKKVVEIRNKIPWLEDWNIDATQQVFDNHMAEELNDSRDTKRTIAVNVPDVDYTDFGVSRDLKIQTQTAGYERAHAVIAGNQIKREFATLLEASELGNALSDNRPNDTRQFTTLARTESVESDFIRR